MTLPGATSSVLTLNNVQTNSTGASYSVEICNGAGCVESTAGTLTVVIPGPPVIQSVTPALGFYWMPGIFNLSVEATAAGEDLVPIHYQWKRNGSAITNVGATMSSFLLGLQPTAELQGDYTVAVANALGTTTSWGFHSSLGSTFSTNGTVVWNGSSSWFIIQTAKSGNGQRNTDFGGFFHWFSSSAFGGTDHANTPVGAVTHVSEPGLSAINDRKLFFGLSAKGKTFGHCAWVSRNTEQFQAVGDPFVRR